MTTATPAGRVRPRRADVRRALLDAAGEAFAAHPYAEVSLAEVAERAGFTKGAVYSNFGGKPQLFAEVLTEQLTAHAEGLVGRALAAPEGEGPDEVAAAVAADLAHGARHATRLPAMLAELRALAAGDPALAAVYVDLRRRQREHLERLLRSGSTRVRLREDLDPAVAALLLLTVVNGTAQEALAASAGAPDPLREAPPAETLLVEAPLIEAMYAHVVRSVLR